MNDFGRYVSSIAAKLTFSYNPRSECVYVSAPGKVHEEILKSIKHWDGKSVSELSKLIIKSMEKYIFMYDCEADAVKQAIDYATIIGNKKMTSIYLRYLEDKYEHSLCSLFVIEHALVSLATKYYLSLCDKIMLNMLGKVIQTCMCSPELSGNYLYKSFFECFDLDGYLWKQYRTEIIDRDTVKDYWVATNPCDNPTLGQVIERLGTIKEEKTFSKIIKRTQFAARLERELGKNYEDATVGEVERQLTDIYGDEWRSWKD